MITLNHERSNYLCFIHKSLNATSWKNILCCNRAKMDYRKLRNFMQIQNLYCEHQIIKEIELNLPYQKSDYKINDVSQIEKMESPKLKWANPGSKNLLVIGTAFDGSKC